MDSGIQSSSTTTTPVFAKDGSVQMIQTALKNEVRPLDNEVKVNV